MTPEYRGICHMVYGVYAGKYRLTGFGYGYYLPKFKTDERAAVIIAEEWKHGENDFRYINKQFIFHNPYTRGPWKHENDMTAA